jgi:hypothetical protein
MDNIKTSSGSTFTTINSVRENNLSIDASSGSIVKGKFNIANDTKVEATSGSDIKIDINSKNFDFKGSSGSSTKFDGQAGMANFDISSGALCKADNLRTNQVEAESTSGGSLSINVVDKLKARASSGGLIKYRGNPEITSDINKISGGTLKQID